MAARATPALHVAVRARRFWSRTPVRLPATLLLGMLGASPAAARPPIAIPPQLRLSAMQCLAEGVRLCPKALTAKDHDLACILSKRHLLSAPCRALSDQALGLLRGGDLHLDLRGSKPRGTVSPAR
ncbi:hypothetical protein [Lichenibacterium ramalinae]|nr:hypothetical protein [Lichenibacterium ramalinae]